MPPRLRPRLRRTALVVLATAVLPGAAACGGAPADGTAPAAGATAAGEVRGHPRLLLRRSDVARLRSWATPRNPMYARGLRRLAATARADMDAGRVPGDDAGTDGWDEHPTEAYAELFAFLSLVERRASVRADYARRARDLVMAVIDEAEEGVGEDEERFRDPQFSTGDRARWTGEGFAFAVDWAHGAFSRADRRRIRRVFLRWAAEQYTAYPLSNLEGPRPRPGGRANDPALLRDRKMVRWSLNNYHLGHARNLGLMALALDPRDDPGGALRRHVRALEGQWLPVIDHALRTEARGGLSPEGFEYGPDAIGRLAQLVTAMRTAGRPAALARNPFWSEALPALLASLPPAPARAPGEESWRGQVFQPAWFGDGQGFWALDPMPLLGPLALDARARGDRKTLDAVRWTVTHVPQGGAGQLLERVGHTDQFLAAILYFMVFEPGAPAPADPRPDLPVQTFAPGIGRTLARTCWCADGRLFAHKLGWNAIDHQIGDGNDFGLWRKGEWLTLQRTQYSSGIGDYTNTLAIRNDVPEYDEDEVRHSTWQRGSQWELEPAGDPRIVARSSGDGWLALTGDATNLYNSDYEGVRDVQHASRSIVWLQPDHVLVYDRARTGKEGRFKRFWLQLPAQARIDGSRATARTAGGQELHVRSLLPEGADLQSTANDGDVGQPAPGGTMRFRLRIEPPSAPRDARFLTVLQGADRGAGADEAIRVRSTGATPYDGVAVAGQAVVFPVELGAAFAGLRVELPADGLRRVLVTGLEPGKGYHASTRRDGDRVVLDLAEGGGSEPDGGGVLAVAAP